MKKSLRLWLQDVIAELYTIFKIFSSARSPQRAGRSLGEAPQKLILFPALQKFPIFKILHFSAEEKICPIFTRRSAGLQGGKKRQNR